MSERGAARSPTVKIQKRLDKGPVSVYNRVMNAEETARQIVREAESKVQELLGQNLQARDYEAVRWLTALAQHLDEIAAGVVTQDSGRRGFLANRPANAKTGPARARTRRSKKRQRKAGYPKFLRRKDQLVKIGYSKRSGEYTHKAPYETLRLVVEAIRGVGTGTDAFVSEDFMPVADPNSGAEVPGYQTYLCLAWLVSVGLVTKHGRQGYSIERTETFAQEAEQFWRAL